MRHPRFGLAVVLGFVALFAPAIRSEAQVAGAGVGADPFSFYYGYYLPHQAAMAATPTPLDTINAITINRQQQAQAERPSLYDPISPYGDDPDLLDPLSKRGRERIAKFQGFASNIKGTGPAGYYNRTDHYYPGLQTRPGRGPNKNIVLPRYSKYAGGVGNMGAPGGGGGGGMGMGMGMPSMPGPR